MANVASQQKSDNENNQQTPSANGQLSVMKASGRNENNQQACINGHQLGNVNTISKSIIWRNQYNGVSWRKAIMA